MTPPASLAVPRTRKHLQILETRPLGTSVGTFLQSGLAKGRKRHDLQALRTTLGAAWRYRRRWIVERTIGWLGNFRRLVMRDDRSLRIYRAFFHIACFMIVLRRVVQ